MNQTAGADQIEREKSIQKDAELQLENATETKTLPVADEAVHITAKTWWVIFVSEASSSVVGSITLTMADSVLDVWAVVLASPYYHSYDSWSCSEVRCHLEFCLVRTGVYNGMRSWIHLRWSQQ